MRESTDDCGGQMTVQDAIYLFKQHLILLINLDIILSVLHGLFKKKWVYEEQRPQHLQ